MKEINGGKQMKDVWTFTSPKKSETEGKHPTQKPLTVLERIILSSTDEGDTILDPFLGSGTTNVAAILKGRHLSGLNKKKNIAHLQKKEYL